MQNCAQHVHVVFVSGRRTNEIYLGFTLKTLLISLAFNK